MSAYGATQNRDVRVLVVIRCKADIEQDNAQQAGFVRTTNARTVPLIPNAVILKLGKIGQILYS
jgi:hypothetical protein